MREAESFEREVAEMVIAVVDRRDAVRTRIAGAVQIVTQGEQEIARCDEEIQVLETTARLWRARHGIFLDPDICRAPARPV